MSRKLAIVGYVFGDAYQGFAPFYAYSILQAYPDYSVLLYFDRPVQTPIRSRLVELASMGDVRFRESYDFGMPERARSSMMSNVLRAGRWLFYDQWFVDFEWIYIGDVDILIVPEPNPLLEGHIAHANFLGLPYSNVIRLTADARALTPGAIRSLWRSRDYRTLQKRMKGEIIPRQRLTGLHFLHRNDYFSAVEPHFEQFKTQIESNGIDVRSRDDEEVLYSLVERSELGLPPISPLGPDLDSRNSKIVNYRPHHGVHLGIFRSDGSILRQRQVLSSYVYAQHFDEYSKLRDEPYFRTLRSETNSYVERLLNAVDQYIGR